MKRRQLADKICALLAEEHLLSALDMVRLLDTGETGYNKTSVYRSLEKLLAAGIVCKHSFGKDEAVYELRDHHHDHLFCTHCGRISVAECHTTIPSEVNGFQVEHHHLTLYGLCYDCAVTHGVHSVASAGE